jgi:DNA end-binding protein Ku
MAEALVASLSAAFEPKKYRDNYREQVLDLIERKAAGEQFEAPAADAAPAPQVIDLMAALEASVKAAKAARGRHPAGAPEQAETPAKPKRVRKSA